MHLDSRRSPGGPVVPFGYTIREQHAAIGDVTGTTIPFSARYTYNPNGTVSQADFYNGGVPDVMIKRFRYFFPAYDALNRLQSADFGRWTGTGWSMTAAHDLPTIHYDRAGNITALQRNGANGALIDNLSYSYAPGTNRLSTVTDAVAGSAASWDAETGSFTYDANGNMLTGPAPYGVTSASYDHRNLPLLITANGVTSAYRYDEQGQRISKRVTGSNLDEFSILDGRTSLGVVTVDGAGGEHPGGGAGDDGGRSLRLRPLGGAARRPGPGWGQVKAVMDAGLIYSPAMRLSTSAGLTMRIP